MEQKRNSANKFLACLSKTCLLEGVYSLACSLTRMLNSRGILTVQR